ncbi:MAG: PilZ domain-containing protein [Rubrivivax sp.]
MKSSPLTVARRALHRAARATFARLPRRARFAVCRQLVRCDPDPGAGLVVKIAETREELEACFALLHDAYVASGFMQPDPSGLRVTPWHALPTTTTICATVNGEVVGTLSMVRDGVFGLPLQSAFDLHAVRAEPGQLAEISALAIRSDYRRTGGTILFPLMKFMYEYCTRYFDTRHLLIAVNPNKIELYEALLFFRRLTAQTVEHYDFANGAAAVGGVLDLMAAPGLFEQAYRGRPARRDLHRYFTRTRLAQIQLPPRPYFTTNDPVMTPALLDHFFNQRTDGFARLSMRQRVLLHAIYDRDDYRAVLPPLGVDERDIALVRRHRRHSIKCPGWIVIDGPGEARRPLNLVDASEGGCRVETGAQGLPLPAEGRLTVFLGRGVRTELRVRVVRRAGDAAWGLMVLEADATWLEAVRALERGATYRDLTIDGSPSASTPGAGAGAAPAWTAAAAPATS